MKILYLFIFTIAIVCKSFAQDFVPNHYIYSDGVLDVESIPNIGYEHFFKHKPRIKSWRVDLAYQVHYSNQFGIVASHGDKISAGVYQGPAAKFGYCHYKNKNRKNWHNYFSPSLDVKYLWYDSMQVNTGKRTTTDAFRIQSEKCYAAVPQFAIGAKHIKDWFCADFFIGLQFPVKDRLKTVYWDQSSAISVNTNVPYKSSPVTVQPGILAGITLGFIKLNKTPTYLEKSGM